MIRAGLAAALSLALTSCATTARAPLASSAHAPAASQRSSTTQDIPSGVPGARQMLVDRALRMLGQPYRWGGAAPGGFDCSGLVAYSAAGAGIQVPRTAHEQVRYGSPIARAHVRAGDLVFMHLASKELHVGIAIDGERFVHAPSSGGRVRIDSLATPPYSRGFETARRIVAAP